MTPTKIKSIVKFQWVSLLPVLISTVFVLFALWYTQQYKLYLPIFLGLISGSVVDIDNRFSGKLINTIVVFFFFLFVEFLVLLTWNDSLLLWITTIFSAFIFVIVGAFSNNFKTIGWGGVLVICYSVFICLNNNNQLENTYGLVWMLIGSTFYTLLSLVAHMLFPNRNIKHHVSELYNKLGDFLKIKSNFFDPDDDSFEQRLPYLDQQKEHESNMKGFMFHRLYNPAYQKAHNSLIAEFTATKNSLLIRLKAFMHRKTTSQMLRFYLTADNIFKALDFNLADYKLLKTRLQNSDIMFRVQRILVLFAKTCYQFSYDLESNRAPKLDKRILVSIEHLEQSILKEHQLQDFHVDSLQLLLAKLKKVYWLLENINNQKMDNLNELTASLKSEKPKRKFSWRSLSLRIASEFTLKSASFRHALRICTFLFFAMLCFEFASLQFAFWFMMAGVLVIQPNYATTKSRVKQRVYGTIVGALVGAMFSFNVYEHPVLISVLASTSLTLFMLYRSLDYGYATFFLTITVFCTFRIAGMPVDVETIIIRIVANAAGALVTWAIMVYLVPEWNYLDLTTYVSRTYKRNRKLTLSIVGCLAKHPITTFELNKRMIQAQNANMSLQSVVGNICNDPQMYKKFVNPAVKIMALNDYIVSNLTLINNLIVESIENKTLDKINSHTINIVATVAQFITNLYDYYDKDLNQKVINFVNKTNEEGITDNTIKEVFDINFYIKERILGIALALISYRREIAEIYRLSANGTYFLINPGSPTKVESLVEEQVKPTTEETDKSTIDNNTIGEIANLPAENKSLEQHVLENVDEASAASSTQEKAILIASAAKLHQNVENSNSEFTTNDNTTVASDLANTTSSDPSSSEQNTTTKNLENLNSANEQSPASVEQNFSTDENEIFDEIIVLEETALDHVAEVAAEKIEDLKDDKNS